MVTDSAEAGVPATLIRRVEALAGSTVVSSKAVDRGHTPSIRLLVDLADKRSAFVKAANGYLTAPWLRAEYRAYLYISGPFMPRLLGWDDNGEQPVLLLEDLRSGHWPPPWPADGVEAVLSTLAQVRSTRMPSSALPKLREVCSPRRCWRLVSADPDEFLELGICSREWLAHALPVLVASEDRSLSLMEGNDVLHGDVRSDNVCLLETNVRLVDWNWACEGNGRFDIALWLPTLVGEVDVQPSELLPDAGDFAALLSGYWGSRASKYAPPSAHSIRSAQKQWASATLHWAAKELGLSPPA